MIGPMHLKQNAQKAIRSKHADASDSSEGKERETGKGRKQEEMTWKRQES